MTKRLKLTLGILLVFILFATYYIHTTIGFCTKPFNKEYFSWFPYTIGDTLYFESNNKEKKFVVTAYTTHHNDTYLKNVKCGCCEESIEVSLYTGIDTLKIEFLNLDNPENCFGTYLSIGKQGMQSYEIKTFSDSINQTTYDFISLENDAYIITKNKGITSFRLDNQTYKLKKIYQAKGRINKSSEGCD